jgi:hypothetical protein
VLNPHQLIAAHLDEHTVGLHGLGARIGKRLQGDFHDEGAFLFFGPVGFSHGLSPHGAGQCGDGRPRLAQSTARAGQVSLIADLVPSLRPDQVVVLDNLRAHHSRVALDAIVKAGCHYLHLPPYSPEFNPIEQAWSKMKTTLRKMALRAVGPLREGIISALIATTAENAVAWIRRIGWRVRA